MTKHGSGESGNGKNGNGSHPGPAPKHYDPLQFRIRARNEFNHSEKIQTQAPPELKAEINSLVSSGMFDFDGEGGFLRWAAVHGIEFLKGYKPQYQSQIAIVRAISEENARSEVRRDFLRSLEQTAKEAFELSGRGYPAEAAKHIHRVISHVRKLSADDIWREIYIKEIKQRFGHLLKVGKVASLMPLGEDTEWLKEIGVLTGEASLN